MLLYILKSSACLAAFMLFYKLCIEKTSVHTFKRFYLIAAILISIGIPFITFVEYIEAQPINSSITSGLGKPSLISDKTKSFQDYLPTILWSIYSIGVLIFSFRFFKNLYQIIQKIKLNPRFKNHNFINVLLKDLITPHTFFNYIFLNKTKYEKNQIPIEVLLHEQTHATQKHALDILFIEILQIIFWFNPLLYFIKKDIKLNHEFLADQSVLKHGYDTKHYQQLLLAFSSNAANHHLASAINYSLIKKRFTVMKTKTSKTAFWIRSLIILPLLVILVYGFSTKTIIEKETSKVKIAIQQKATPEQVAEYNKLAKKYNAQPENERIIKSKDVKRLEYLYGLMSDEQKENAEPFPNLIPPPPPPLQVVDESKMSAELLKTKKTFFEKGKEYGEAVSLYVKEGKESYGNLKAKYNEVMQLYNKYNELVKKEDISIPPPPPAPKEPKTLKAVNDSKVLSPPKAKDIVEVPPPPPPPKSPLEHVKEMAKKGATFYYNGKKVSSGRAIELMEKNKSLNISTNTNDGVTVVKIQTEPITN